MTGISTLIAALVVTKWAWGFIWNMKRDDRRRAIRRDGSRLLLSEFEVPVFLAFFQDLSFEFSRSGPQEKCNWISRKSLDKQSKMAGVCLQLFGLLELEMRGGTSHKSDSHKLLGWFPSQKVRHIESSGHLQLRC